MKTYLLLLASVATMMYGWCLWFQNPELSQMQVLINYWHIWLAAMVFAVASAAIGTK